MGMCMRVSFTRGNPQEVVFIIIMSMEDTRVIGLMVSMMAMVLRLGLVVAATGANTVRAQGMATVCIDFTQEICMQGNGLMGKAMDMVCRLVKMAVGMLESLNVGLSMDLGTTTSGMFLCLYNQFLL